MIPIRSYVRVWIATGHADDGERGLVLEAGGGVKQPGDLVAAEHHGQLARMREPDKPAR